MQHHLLKLLHTAGAHSTTVKNEYDRPNPPSSLPAPPSATNENLDFWNHIIKRRIKQLERLDLESLKSVRDGIVRLLLVSDTNDGDDDDDVGNSSSGTTTRQKISNTSEISKQQITDSDMKEQYVSVVQKVLVCYFYNSVDTRIDRNERLESLQRMKEILNCLDMANANVNTNLIK